MLGIKNNSLLFYLYLHKVHFSLRYISTQVQFFNQTTKSGMQDQKKSSQIFYRTGTYFPWYDPSGSWWWKEKLWLGSTVDWGRKGRRTTLLAKGTPINLVNRSYKPRSDGSYFEKAGEIFYINLAVSYLWGLFFFFTSIQIQNLPMLRPMVEENLFKDYKPSLILEWSNIPAKLTFSNYIAGNVVSIICIEIRDYFNVSN